MRFVLVFSLLAFAGSLLVAAAGLVLAIVDLRAGAWVAGGGFVSAAVWFAMVAQAGHALRRADRRELMRMIEAERRPRSAVGFSESHGGEDGTAEQ